MSRHYDGDIIKGIGDTNRNSEGNSGISCENVNASSRYLLPHDDHHLEGGEEMREEDQSKFSVSGDHPITPRFLKVPRREQAWRVLKHGKTGHKRTFRHVFNACFTEMCGTLEKKDEPLSNADIRLMYGDIRTELYEKKNLTRGSLTFQDLGRDCPDVLFELRRNIEERYGLLQLCIEQWGVEWAIKEVLQRDRKPNLSKHTGPNNDVWDHSGGTSTAQLKDTPAPDNKLLEERKICEAMGEGKEPLSDGKIGNDVVLENEGDINEDETEPDIPPHRGLKLSPFLQSQESNPFLYQDTSPPGSRRRLRKLCPIPPIPLLTQNHGSNSASEGDIALPAAVARRSHKRRRITMSSDSDCSGG